MIVDKDFNIVCEPKQSINVGRNHSYFDKLYWGHLISFGGNSFDGTLDATVYSFEPECLKPKGISVLVKNYSAKAAEAKIKDRVAQQILSDFGITR